MAESSRTNAGFIGLIVAVATIGGFMFGYDSGAINGTQDGLRHTFGLSDWQLGLTVSALHEDGFSVALIPETLERTKLGSLREGDTVNVEVDVLSKYVERHMAARVDGGRRSTGARRLRLGLACGGEMAMPAGLRPDQRP